MNNKTVLVTGGAGFIGSHLCKMLLEKGERVICLDNLFTGSEENIKVLYDNPNFRFIKHDIINPFFASEHIDQVYNLACPASPPAYQFNAIRTVKANTVGMINMLGLAKLHNARILQASTSEVYGDPLQHPQTESYWGNVNCNGIRSCYDEGKRVAETLCFDYHRQNKVDIKIVRIFNTYGPNMDPQDGRVVSNFIMQALKNEDITIYGDGNQTRSFCYVDDLVKGIYLMMNSKDEFCGPVNLGNPGEFTILELAKKVIEVIGCDSKIVYQDLPSDDPKVRKPDITLAYNKLGWKPSVDIDNGLINTIKYFRKFI
ncbi:SDR family oxidoreductase [Candidatus Woesearchaeota archaeon]|nr:SDR family oxidoreductase [Candidatus Woesearchaeota archaeon]